MVCAQVWDLWEMAEEETGFAEWIIILKLINNKKEIIFYLLLGRFECSAKCSRQNDWLIFEKHRL